MTAPDPARDFVPAAGHDRFLPLYDPLFRLLGEHRIRQRLIDAAGIEAGQRVLDVGCGTGTLAVRIRRQFPETEVVAIDPDPKALGLARRKAEKAGVAVEWRQGFADALPFEDSSFDRIVSSLVFHHLPPEVVRKTVPELRRVLRVGGRISILDFGRGGHAGLHGMLTRLIHHQHGEEDVAGELAGLMEQAGLQGAQTGSRQRTLFGPLFLTQAELPPGG